MSSGTGIDIESVFALVIGAAALVGEAYHCDLHVRSSQCMYFRLSHSRSSTSSGNAAEFWHWEVASDTTTIQRVCAEFYLL